MEKQKINKTSYNKIVNEWDSARKNGSISSLLVLFASKLKSRSKILDIGCGTGNPVTKYLSEKDFVITGIDIAEEMIKKAKELNLKNTTLLVTDFFDYNPIEKFDGVVAFDSFFHFGKDQQKDIYKKVSSMLTKSGYLLFTHGKKDNEIIDKMFNEEFYYSSLAINDVKQLLKESDFDIIELIEDYKENNDIRELIILAIKSK